MKRNRTMEATKQGIISRNQHNHLKCTKIEISSKMTNKWHGPERTYMGFSIILKTMVLTGGGHH